MKARKTQIKATYIALALFLAIALLGGMGWCVFLWQLAERFQ